jgi:hypothetical protein
MKLPWFSWIVFYRWSRINPIWSHRTLARFRIPIQTPIALAVRAIRCALTPKRPLNCPGRHCVNAARVNRYYFGVGSRSTSVQNACTAKLAIQRNSWSALRGARWTVRQ